MNDIWKKEYVWTNYDVQPGYPAWKQEVKNIYDDTFIADSHYFTFNWSKYLCGITFRYIQETEDIYKIDKTVSSDDYSLNNYYNPYDIIKEYYSNVHYVDIACDFNVYTSENYFELDGVKLKPGNRILLFGNYNKRENGVYLVDNKYFLIKTDDLSNYSKTYRYQVYCKSGKYTNKHLFLVPIDNIFPVEGNLIEFKEGRGLILMNTINYDVYNTGQTSGNCSKILYTDNDLARKQLVFNSDLYEGIELSGITIDELSPLNIGYMDSVYTIRKTINNIVYDNYYYSNNSFNIYNYSGQTHIKTTTGFIKNIGDYVNLRVYYTELDNPFLDNNYFNLNTQIKEVKTGDIIVIEDIIPNYILDIIGSNFSGYVINNISGGTINDMDEIFNDNFSYNLSWNLTNYFTISSGYLNLIPTGSSATSQAYTTLWTPTISASTYKLSFTTINYNVSGAVNGSIYLSGSTGQQKILDIYPTYTGVATYTVTFTSNNSYDTILFEFDSSNVTSISFDNISLSKINNTYLVDSGLTLFLDMNEYEYIEYSASTFYTENFDSVGTWTLDANMNISGGSLNFISPSPIFATQTKATTTIDNILSGFHVNLSFDVLSYSGNTTSAIYLSGSSSPTLLATFNSTGTTVVNDILITCDCNKLVIALETSGLSGASIDNINIELVSETLYPNIVQDNTLSYFLTGNSISLLDDGVYNKCYNFVDGYLNLPNGIIQNNKYSTISVWFKTIENGVILGHQNSSTLLYCTNYSPILYIGNDGKLRLSLNNIGNNQIATTFNVNDNVWHNVIVTIYNTGATLYVDTTLIGNLSNIIWNNDMIYSQLGLGYCYGYSESNNDWFYFNGKLDEFGFWNRNLNIDEIKYIYNLGKGSSYYVDPQTILSDSNKYRFEIRNLNYTDNDVNNFIRSIDSSYFNDFIKTDIEFLRNNEISGVTNIISTLSDKYGLPLDSFIFSNSGDFNKDFGDFGFYGYSSFDNSNIVFTGTTTGITTGEYYSNPFLVSKGEKFLFKGNISYLTDNGEQLLSNTFSTTSSITLNTGFTVTLLQNNSFTGSSLISYYDFETNIDKVTPINILQNVDIIQETGLVKYAYKYDGWTSYSQLLNDLTGLTEQSISLWFKTTSSGIIIGQQDSSYPNSSPSNRNPLLYVGNDGKLRGGFYNHKFNDISNTVYDDKWHHVVLMISGQSQWIYLDGVQKGYITGLPTYGFTGYNYNYFGTGLKSPDSEQILTSNYYFFDGYIDEFSHWNRVLNQEEISLIYNNRYGSTYNNIETYPYYTAIFSSVNNSQSIIKSSTFTVTSGYWYKLEAIPFELSNIDSLEVSLVNLDGSINSFIVSENASYLSQKYTTSSLVINENENIIFQAINSGVCYIQYVIKPKNLTTEKKLSLSSNLYEYHKMTIDINIKDIDKNIISNTINIDSVGLTEGTLQIVDTLPTTNTIGFLFATINVFGTPGYSKEVIGDFKLFRISDNFKLSINPKYSDNNRYFYYDEFKFYTSTSYILDENENYILSEDDDYLILETSNDTPLQFSTNNNYINYKLQPFLYRIWSGFTTTYQIGEDFTLTENSYTIEFIGGSSGNTIKIYPNDLSYISKFKKFTYVKYPNSNRYALVLDVLSDSILIEKCYGFDTLTNFDIQNITNLGDISYLIHQNYVRYSISPDIFNTNNIDLSKKISDAYAKIIELDENIQKYVTGFIFRDENNKYILKIFNQDDDLLQYNPVEISVIGVEGKYKFPLTLENNNLV